MMQIKNISKHYQTGELSQTALNNVSLNLRDNEFVAILGPSGSGKTTLLNIIGGLDRYDSGDLVINGISTEKYKDRDWDSYRNHTIGFVFQSYNLIPHQSVLSNVELALTISGISRNERRERAKKALQEVGLGDQIHKKPNQMSGGQMQRVAIARALVNDPDILLADEPTGALDTETSLQVMELLKDVAKDRLVVMVTHNPELAEKYATRIVKLSDGIITDDSMPYEIEEAKADEPVHKNMGKSSMSFFTALSLSFNNLRTKKGRTVLTSFAGSIGIIGIALILSISTGVNAYISDIQKSTMTSYPITVQSETYDLSSAVSAARNVSEDEHELDGVYSNSTRMKRTAAVSMSLVSNNLTKFREYLENPDSEIHKYVGENGIVYSYDMNFGIYTYDPEDVFINTDGSDLQDGTSSVSPYQMMNFAGNISDFEEMIPGQNGEMISAAVTDNYQIVYGSYPNSYDEIVIVLNENNEVSANALYRLGYLPVSEYKDIMKKMNDGEDVSFNVQKWSYEDICSKEFYLIPACDTYIDNTDGTFTFIDDDYSQLEEISKNAIKLKISGIIKPKDENSITPITSAVGYTKALTDYIIEYTDNSAVVMAQIASPDVNVLNGLSFEPGDDNSKIEDTTNYISSLGITEKANFFRQIMTQTYGASSEYSQRLAEAGEAELSAMLDAYLENPSDDVILAIYDRYISTGSYEENLAAFGAVSLDTPSSINIYADSFEDKDSISECIEKYNEAAGENDKIIYTDYVGLIMSSVTTIINVISYVLIAFVAVSLVVSSIMIGIITYISVLERTKEIGILRAIGASKRNISEVFNAETFIIGLFSGIMGILITLLLLIPANAIIHSLAETNDVNAFLPVTSAVILIALSVVLTLIGGIIPSRKAAKKDPVTALRTE